MKVALSRDEAECLLRILNPYRDDSFYEEIYFRILCAIVEQTAEEEIHI